MNNHQQIGFADIHTHILPGVDDGAPDMATARNLVQAAHKDNIRTIFLTPHYRGVYRKNSPSCLQETFAKFSAEMKAAFPEMQFHLGCEIHHQSDVPALLIEQKLLTLANSQYILLEFGNSSSRSQVVSAIYEIVRNGFTPIIAHAERYPAFRNDLSLADEVLELGALIQLNADSIMGKLGFGVKRFCHKLLKSRCVHFVASDAHNLVQRPPLLQDCYKHICKKYREDYAVALFCDNPQAIIDNRII